MSITVFPKCMADYYRKLTDIHGSPLMLLDCDQVARQYRALKAALPRAKFHYALKSNANPDLINALLDEGSGLDIATSGEINILKSCVERPAGLIHTHPFKTTREIEDALDYGCRVFVADSPEELHKLAPYRDQIGLMIRVSFKNKNARLDLSKKFGTPLAEIPALVEEARKLELTVRGLSFHVGSQCINGEAHAKAIRDCMTLWSGLERNATEFDTLDIGGGYPAPYFEDTLDIDSFCAPIRDAITEVPRHMKIIAEPGRFISGPSATLISTIIGATETSGIQWYILDDGMYGSFSGSFYSGTDYPIQVFSDSEERHLSMVAGPTCDSTDTIYENVDLPKLRGNDLVVAPCMGAYTLVTASEFNSIPKAKCITLNGHKAETAALQKQLRVGSDKNDE
jgi:ornithine decarboxylase